MIYNNGLKSLDRTQWVQSAAQFDEVQRQHPYSPWAERAMLMASYARYRARDYEKSISSAEEYIALHPGGEGAAYADHPVAICHFPDQIIDVGRDQARSDLALLALKKLQPASRVGLFARRRTQDRHGARPAGWKGNGGRPLLPAAQRAAGRDQPFQESRHRLSDHDPRPGSVASSG